MTRQLALPESKAKLAFRTFGVRRVSRRFDIFRIAARPRAALISFGLRYVPVPLSNTTRPVSLYDYVCPSLHTVLRPFKRLLSYPEPYGISHGIENILRTRFLQCLHKRISLDREWCSREALENCPERGSCDIRRAFFLGPGLCLFEEIFMMLHHPVGEWGEVGVELR